MKKAMLSRLLITAALLLYLAAGFLIYAGYDKMTNYRNSDYVQKNAYVGGDAYNFIINGTYSAGFFALASGAAVSGTVFLCAGLLTASDKEGENSQPDNKNTIQEVKNEREGTSED